LPNPSNNSESIISKIWLFLVLGFQVYTYEVSPVFILMEEMVLKEMRKIVGYEDGKGDGIFCPGGSMANGYAISCARFNAFPDIKVRICYIKKVKKFQ
jgi:glutamate/tyrosine decarboxylase-like PLP-dependent enzyme